MATQVENKYWQAPPTHHPMCVSVCSRVLRSHRQERIEASGPLGAAPSANPHLDVVESELAAAAAQGVSDGFTLYLSALLEIERWGYSSCCVVWCGFVCVCCRPGASFCGVCSEH